MLFRSVIVEPLRPLPDPWQVVRHLHARGKSRILFFDSAQKHDLRGRYSYVMAEPTEWFSGRYDEIGDPFLKLAERLAKSPAEALPGLPPFQGGAAGLFGYELGHTIEKLPVLSPNRFELPDLAVGIYPWVLAWDHQSNEAWLIVQPGSPAPQTIREWIRPASDSGQHFHEQRTIEIPGFEIVRDGVLSNFNRERFLHSARRSIDYIHAGDCFQINLAQTLVHRAIDTPLNLYQRLRERNPAPFAAYFDTGEGVILSASPERFLKVSLSQVETRPIKGTRPRSATSEQDDRLKRDLQSSAKDRAENVMIVDLLRNDIGKSCEFGSVVVPKVCEIESFETVHHMVSEVRGRLRNDQSPLHLLRNCFPGGSVTGAPKVRAMEIISELEQIPRGAYCGSLGFIGFDGTMDTNILIRTITAAKGWWTFPVGGGLVADSVPEQEYEETWDKAAGLLKALK